MRARLLRHVVAGFQNSWKSFSHLLAGDVSVQKGKRTRVHTFRPLVEELEAIITPSQLGDVVPLPTPVDSPPSSGAILSTVQAGNQSVGTSAASLLQNPFAGRVGPFQIQGQDQTPSFYQPHSAPVAVRAIKSLSF